MTQQIKDLRTAHAELTSLRARRGYFRLTTWQRMIDAVLAALPDLLVMAAKGCDCVECLAAMQGRIKDNMRQAEIESHDWEGKAVVAQADLAETLYTLETTENTLRTEIEQLKSLLADDLKRRNRLEIDNAELRAEVERLQERDKKLVAKIREADAKWEAWAESPDLVCEEYDDFCVAWESVMKALEEA